MAFVLGACLLVALGVGFVLFALRSGASKPGAVVADPYRERREEIERERADGTLDDATYQQLYQELERRVLEERSAAELDPRRHRGTARWPWVVGLALPLLALGLYREYSGVEGWRAQQLFERSQREAEAGIDNRATLDRLSERLHHLLENAGADARGRYLLARVEMERGELAAAAREYERLAAERPEDAGIQAQAAQAAYLAGEQRITPAVRERVQRALTLEPRQPTALGLAGIDAYEQGRYREAVDYWQRLLAQLPEDAPSAGVIRNGVERARAQLGETGPADDNGELLEVSVTLPEGEDDEGVLFVFARVPGERMPLAAARIDAPEFPLSVTLGDAQSLNPERPLSDAERVEVLARLSRSGQVAPAAGDLEARSEALDPASREAPLDLRLRPRTD